VELLWLVFSGSVAAVLGYAGALKLTNPGALRTLIPKRFDSIAAGLGIAVGFGELTLAVAAVTLPARQGAALIGALFVVYTFMYWWAETRGADCACLGAVTATHSEDSTELIGGVARRALVSAVAGAFLCSQQSLVRVISRRRCFWRPPPSEPRSVCWALARFGPGGQWPNAEVWARMCYQVQNPKGGEAFSVSDWALRPWRYSLGRSTHSGPPTQRPRLLHGISGAVPV
jgi:hypothetical protein